MVLAVRMTSPVDCRVDLRQMLSVVSQLLRRARLFDRPLQAVFPSRFAFDQIDFLVVRHDQSVDVMVLLDVAALPRWSTDEAELLPHQLGDLNVVERLGVLDTLQRFEILLVGAGQFQLAQDQHRLTVRRSVARCRARNERVRVVLNRTDLVQIGEERRWQRRKDVRVPKCFVQTDDVVDFQRQFAVQRSDLFGQFDQLAAQLDLLFVTRAVRWKETSGDREQTRWLLVVAGELDVRGRDSRFSERNRSRTFSSDGSTVALHFEKVSGGVHPDETFVFARFHVPHDRFED